jgi:hypothetical protein
MIESPEATPSAPGTLKRRTLVVWIGSLLASSVAVSGTIGALGASHGFDWSLAAVAGTAFGTIVLAGFTGALAWTTSGDVRATWELAKLTERDQAERERPLVIVQRAEMLGRGPAGAWLKLWLRNVGLGPALRVRVTATYVDPSPQVAVTGIVIPAIAPDETAEHQLEVTWQSGDGDPQAPRADGFPIEGKYLDRARRNEYPIIANWDEPA